MAEIQTINIGSSANDGTGDTIRAGMDKVNDNFANFKIEGTNFTGSILIGHSTTSGFLTSATGNTGVGIDALDAINQGDSNTVVGNSAGTAITNGSFNVAIGSNALKTEDVHGANTAVGYAALQDQDAGANAYNVAIGYNAGHDVSTGVDNVIIGGEAGNSLTTGARNVFIGRRAAENAVGSDCIAIGDDAMAGGGGGGGNIAIGHEAFLAHVRTNSPGVEGDIAIGHEAGKTMAGAGSVSKVVLLGFQAGTVMTRSGANNSTVIGYQAGVAITSGNSNTIIGSNAGDALETGDNNIIIGHGAAASSTSVDNEIALGDGDIATIRAQVTSISSLSDKRDKKDIEDSVYGLDFVDSLKPVTFEWDQRDGKRLGLKDVGFIAQDLQEVDDEYTRLVYESNPERLEATYGRLIPIMAKAIQELSAKVKQLENK